LDLVPAAGFFLFDLGACPHHDAAAALLVALLDALLAVDDAARREVGSADELAQVLHRSVRVVDQMVNRLHHLAQVVRGDVGRHADRDARRPVDDQVGQLSRQDRRLL